MVRRGFRERVFLGPRFVVFATRMGRTSERSSPGKLVVEPYPVLGT